MTKLTVAEAAEHFNVSKEAIHNRVRRGTLNAIIENNQKYILIESSAPIKAKSEKPDNNNKYYDYIERENELLKSKVALLEDETKSLRNQREQMLIDERIKIEQIYKERDEQLKNVLQVVENKFLAHFDKTTEPQSVEAEIVEINDVDLKKDDERAKPMALKEFLKDQRVKDKNLKKIKKRFEKAVDKQDKRVLIKKGKLYVMPTSYNYTDFFK